VVDGGAACLQAASNKQTTPAAATLTRKPVRGLTAKLRIFHPPFHPFIASFPFHLNHSMPLTFMSSTFAGFFVIHLRDPVDIR
jgi:hypothetical protein